MLIAALGQTGHWSAGGEQLQWASLVFLGFYFSLSPSYNNNYCHYCYFTLSNLLNCSYVSLQVLPFSDSLSHPIWPMCGRKWKSSCRVFSCPLVLNHNSPWNWIETLKLILATVLSLEAHFYTNEAIDIFLGINIVSIEKPVGSWAY